MAHYLPLASYPQLYHPHHQPGNPSIQPHSASALASLTSYTNQFILSADEHEAKLAALYQKFGEKRDEAIEKMDDKENERDTAYLIEKTDQQTFVSFVVGVVLTGLLYTGLLIFKPSSDCKKGERGGEGFGLAGLGEHGGRLSPDQEDKVSDRKQPCLCSAVISIHISSYDSVATHSAAHTRHWLHGQGGGAAGEE